MALYNCPVLAHHCRRLGDDKEEHKTVVKEEDAEEGLLLPAGGDEEEGVGEIGDQDDVAEEENAGNGRPEAIQGGQLCC